ncbi:MAG: amidase [Proteobacteria bacterium]|nr:amidase [Pseudomonadota bacterium]
MQEFAKYDALGLAELVKNKDVKPIELVEAAIGRIESVNDKLGCVNIENYENARAQAEGVVPDGPFSGVPLLLKDLITGYEGMRTSNGSRYFKEFTAPVDSAIATRINEGGFIRLAKTVTPEFGYCIASEPEIFPPARNPWNPEHTPGGSSGGSSSAVAARVVPIATASDGGGSIRIPASNGGLVGLKASRGRTTMAPYYADLWYGCVVEGCVSLTVRDQAAYHDLTQYGVPGEVYAVPRPATPYLQEVGKDPGKLRIGMIKKAADGQTLHPECIAAVENAARLCESLGHHVEEAEYSFDYQELTAIFTRIACAATAAGILASEPHVGRAPRQGDFTNAIQEMLERGQQQNAAEHYQDVEAMHQIGWTVAADCDPYDVVLTPTLPNPPRKVGYFDMSLPFDEYNFDILVPEVVFTLPHNVSGLPGISLPLHWSADGLPCGVQFLTKHANDGLLFRLAAQLEEAQPWFDKVPPIHA